DLGSAEVCVGEEIEIINNTMPFCPECSWNWDLGNGVTTQAFNPSGNEYGAWWEYDVLNSYADMDLSYESAGVYTINASVENENNFSSTSKQVTVIENVPAEFTIERTGNTITVTATADNASSWNWDFGDGTTATGQSATHTYESLVEPKLVVLSTEAANGCTGQAYQFVQTYQIYLPMTVR
ncbi:MAG: PKD domain-containing protein, partial [Anaerolineales bacterium]|nr:PKD domain-containing protein [Anaerolineales bacterium]